MIPFERNFGTTWTINSLIVSATAGNGYWFSPNPNLNWSNVAWTISNSKPPEKALKPNQILMSNLGMDKPKVLKNLKVSPRAIYKSKQKSRSRKQRSSRNRSYS